MDAHLARAQLLLEQGRHEMAEKELRQAIAEGSDPAFARSLLALCLCERKRYDEATNEVREAIVSQPDFAFAHYAHAQVMLHRRRIDEAVAPAEEALRLEPENAAYFALMAQIRMEQRRWTEALAAADAGLAIDAQDVTCNNLRAMALTQLGRRQEAGATIESALARQPENSTTHANQGWTLLHQGDPKKAMDHFREALRLQPGNEWARAGILEAIKARNPVYGLMLRYFLFMSRLSGRAQWMVILGLFFGQRVLRATAKANPALEPWVMPILVAYVAFVLMAWISVPLFNLILRLHPVGKHALSDEQKRASNWVGACLFLSLASLGVWVGLGSPWSAWGEFGALTFGLILIPLCGVFNCHAGWPRWLMAGITAVLFLLRAGVVLVAIAGPEKDRMEIIRGLNMFFFLGAFLSQFAANALMQVEPKR
jgi:tetratricopeptide (TPR) repeat protein